MFYSSDILSRRRDGLGIVWLAATLGDRSVVRRITRRDVMTVNIPRACRMVIAPPEPMALRLSSQLMYGVVRIYEHQTDLLSQEVNNVHVSLRREIQAIPAPLRKPPRVPPIDMTTRLPRVEAITHTIDLTFFALDFEPIYAANLDAAVGRAPTPIGITELYRSPRFIEPEERITLPAPYYEEVPEVGVPRERLEELGLVPPEGVEEIDLGLVEGMEPFLPRPPSPMVEVEALPPPVSPPSAEEVEALFPLEGPPMEEELAPPVVPPVEVPGLELGPPPPPPPALPPIPAVVPARRPFPTEEEVAEAQQRRERRRRLRLVLDPRTDLTDEELRASRRDYMAEMTAQRAQLELRTRERNQVNMAQQMIFGPPTYLASAPQLSELWSTTVDARFRFVRDHYAAMRTSAIEEEMAAPPPLPPPEIPEEVVEEEEMEMLPPLLPLEEYEEVPTWIPEVEIGRALVPEALPWNAFVEQRRRTEEEATAAAASVSISGLPPQLADITPLLPREFLIETPTGLGRIPSLPLLEPPSPSIPTLEESFLRRISVTPSLEGLELGPPPLPPPPPEEYRSPTPPSQVFQEEIERETHNFFEYTKSVKTELADPQFLFFSDLAPVASSSPTVAAQAFYHVLALATNRMLKVRQDVAYGEIQIEIIE